MIVDTPLSPAIRSCLAEVVRERGAWDFADKIDAGDDVILIDVCGVLTMTLPELAAAWAIKVHDQLGLLLYFSTDGKVTAFKPKPRAGETVH